MIASLMLNKWVQGILLILLIILGLNWWKDGAVKSAVNNVYDVIHKESINIFLEDIQDAKETDDKVKSFTDDELDAGLCGGKPCLGTSSFEQPDSSKAAMHSPLDRNKTTTRRLPTYTQVKPRIQRRSYRDRYQPKEISKEVSEASELLTNLCESELGIEFCK